MKTLLPALLPLLLVPLGALHAGDARRNVLLIVSDDRAPDPHESTNLAADPRHAATLAELRGLPTSTLPPIAPTP